MCVGAIPVSTATNDRPAHSPDSKAHLLHSDGDLRRNGSTYAYGVAGATFRAGDRMTVRLDLDACTITFSKNDAALGATTLTDILRQPYYFCIDAYTPGDGATIESVS